MNHKHQINEIEVGDTIILTKRLQGEYFSTKLAKVCDISEDTSAKYIGIEKSTKGKITRINKIHDQEYQLNVEWENGNIRSILYPIDQFEIIDKNKDFKKNIFLKNSKN